MDTSRFKRRNKQKPRQKVETETFGNSAPVPKALPAQPQNHSVTPVNHPQTTTAPLVNRFRAQAPANHAVHPRPRQRQVMDMGFASPRTAISKQPAASQPVHKTEAAINKHKPSIAKLVTSLTVEQPAPIDTAAAAPVLTSTEAARRVPIDMDLPGEESPGRFGGVFGKTRLAIFRRWAFRGIAVALALFIVGGGLLFSQGYLKAHKVFRGGAGTAAALKEKVDPDMLKGEGSGRINVLLLGRGGGSHDAPDLTDTIMLASIDPINHKTTLFSIPRDLWVNVPSAGNMKINAVWQTGVYNYLGKRVNGTTDKNAIAAGYKAIDQTIEDVMGVNVDYNMIVDFKAFSQAIDTVGGLGVNVPADLVDPTMAWENGNNPVLAKAGTQVFDGKHALIYVRSRETSSDFARSQRQRAVLLGLKAKVDTLGTLSNPVKISNLINAFGNNVQTDLSLKNASRLYGIIKRINDTDTNSIGFADPPNQFVTTGNITGQSVVLPKSGLFKYADIQAFVRNQLQDPYILKEKARVMVLNGTTLEGLATAKANELRSYGYNVVKTGETPTTGWTQTTLVNLSKGRNKYTAHYLEQRLGVTALNKLPDAAIQTNGADFVIIVGSDKATPQQN